MEITSTIIAFVGTWIFLTLVCAAINYNVRNLEHAEWREDVFEFLFDTHRKIFLFNFILLFFQIVVGLSWFIFYPIIFIIKIFVVEIKIGWLFKRVK